MSDERVWLPTGDALAMLPDGDDDIHTFRSAAFGLIGADWRRDDIVAEINKCDCEIGGKMCRGMNHGLVVWTSETDPLFVETRKGAPEEYKEAQKQQPTTACVKADAQPHA